MRSKERRGKVVRANSMARRGAGGLCGRPRKRGAAWLRGRRPREGRPCQLDGAAGLGDVVQPPEKAELGIVQRLDAEGDAVDAGSAVAAEAFRLDARRIGFEGDLGVGRDAPVL